MSPHRIPLLLLGALLAAGCARDGRASFSLSGIITAPAPIQKQTELPNIVLHIVATNQAGVPLAVQKIVNPRLPIHYRMTSEDLVLPGPAWTGPLQVMVTVNTHGKLGVPLKDDLHGNHQGLVRTGARHVDVVINKKI